MRIKDRILVCTLPFVLIFGAGLLYTSNRDMSNVEIFSRRYWDFTWFLSSEPASPRDHFLVGLTVVVNRGLLGGDELVSSALDLLGSRSLLTRLLRLWDTSPRGTPTLTALLLILASYQLCSVLGELRRARSSGPGGAQSKDAIIENLDRDLAGLVKKMAKNRQNERSINLATAPDSGTQLTDEISGLENSVARLSSTASEITESLYCFLSSAFHTDNPDLPDSNEHLGPALGMNKPHHNNPHLGPNAPAPIWTNETTFSQNYDNHLHHNERHVAGREGEETRDVCMRYELSSNIYSSLI